ncbi:MAG TPA: ABC transporter permease [Candidatus Sulfopaludibacter sp.]|nr:ABC transporter permease [Candidatus Sulfopaludibacter sp.]
MRHWKRFCARLANLFRKRRADAELDREMAAHLALLEEDFQRRGMTARDARLAARRAMGGVEQAKELHRDARSFVWVEQALQDLRHSLRGLARSRSFTAVALLSLAFGIGVNTAIFTLVNAILLKRLPVHDPDRIVQAIGQHKPADTTFFSYPAFRELRRRREVFQNLTGVSLWSTTMRIDGGASHPVAGETITGSYFAFFGAHPALGRLLNEEDDAVEGANPVCVIGYELWQGFFGADPRVIGRRVQVGGNSLQVVGVAPPGFMDGEMQRRFDVWMPTAQRDAVSSRENANSIWLQLLGRLAPGVSMAQANARLAAATPAIEAALPRDRANKGQIFQVRDGSKGFDRWRTSLHDPLVVLMGAVALVLLVACANLANLLLARSHERRQEFAIKLSLGISRWRLLRELLLETFLLAFAGGALANWLARLLTRFLLAVFNAGNPYFRLEVAPDSSMLLFTFAACAVTALIAGLYPAWQASRADAAAGLKGGAAGVAERSGVRRGLILVQVTLAVVLLFGASLFTHSLRNLVAVDLGYDIDRMLVVPIAQTGPAKAFKPVKNAPEFREILERTRQLPLVESAALSNPGFLSMKLFRTFPIVQDGGTPRRLEAVRLIANSPGFPATLRLPLLRGRDFTPADGPASPPVAMVNRRFAAQAWPNQDPIGKHFRDGSGNDVEVVGLMGDMRLTGVRDEVHPLLALPFAQQELNGEGMLQIRCRGAQAEVERQVREIVKSVAPSYLVQDVASLDLMRDRGISQDRLLAFLSDLFGALGVALALVGIYGLISYSVTRRTREVGIRMSVGAERGDVVWLFLREIAVLLVAGMSIGLPAALLLARYAGKLLYKVPPSDPLAIAATLALLGAGALAASLLPARRATRINPVSALRYD